MHVHKLASLPLKADLELVGGVHAIDAEVARAVDASCEPPLMSHGIILHLGSWLIGLCRCQALVACSSLQLLKSRVSGLRLHGRFQFCEVSCLWLHGLAYLRLLRLCKSILFRGLGLKRYWFIGAITGTKPLDIREPTKKFVLAKQGSRVVFVLVLVDIQMPKHVDLRICLTDPFSIASVSFFLRLFVGAPFDMKHYLLHAALLIFQCD
mmetsp:Transcript_33068/g.59353  ORF Transcript_33068/g.59353 Transcript_33068/m.59353 type:complete len:209 (+) Transcript_33068:516-1142(+)